MATFDFTQDKMVLERAGLLQENAQGALVRDPKTDPAIMVSCDSLGLGAAAGTPLGLSNVLKVMANRSMDKTLQHGNWTMDNNLTTHTQNYGAFDAYVIRYVKTFEE